MTALSALLREVQRLHEATPDLAAFAPWPTDMIEDPRQANAVPALGLIAALSKPSPLVAALKAAASQLEWRRTYSAEEVGTHFLATYGYVELFGPSGHFHCETLRGYLAFWGPGLAYDWHHHEAEELYFCLSGHARFYASLQPDAVITPGMTRRHAPFEQHAMDTTTEAPFLCYALWKGPGLAELPRMVRPGATMGAQIGA